MFSPVLDWLDSRIGYREILRREILEKVVPRHRNLLTYLGCFGGLSLILFGIQVVSGVVLLVHYTPHPDRAFESVRHIMNDVPYGWLFRRAHAVGASFLVITALIHMLKVFCTGAYKPPRELNWMTGALLMILTFSLCFSGYLLPWSQLSYWASTVGTEVPGSIPLVGPYLVELLRGGQTVDQNTLGLFFALHVAVLPGVSVLFMVGHFYMIRRTGISEPL